MKTLHHAKQNLKTITDAYASGRRVELSDPTLTLILGDLLDLQSEDSCEAILSKIPAIREKLFAVYRQYPDNNLQAFQLLILLSAAFPANARSATNYLICPESDSLIAADHCLPMPNGFVYHKLELFGADDEDLLKKYDRLLALGFLHEELQFHFDFSNINIYTPTNCADKKAEIYTRQSRIHTAVSLFVYTLGIAAMVASTALFCLLLLPLMGTVEAVFAIGGLCLGSLYWVLATCVSITRKTKPGPATELAFSKWLIEENLKVNLANDILANEMKGTKELLKAIHIYPQQGEPSASPVCNSTPSTPDNHPQTISLSGEADDQKPEPAIPGQFGLKNWSPGLFQSGSSGEENQPGLPKPLQASRATV